MEDILIQDEVHRDVHDYDHESFDKDEVQVVGMPYFAWQLLNYHMNLLDDGLKLKIFFEKYHKIIIKLQKSTEKAKISSEFKNLDLSN